ncbi:rod shape-determining protein MreC [Parabacteroides sp. PF5-5]|uniref:rod shape-determining protein MreC n=1 Tax=unclassified Parabacteroides TaxID=2649774 RepID=UPI0024761322|nr:MULTISPECIES: rod shape-determining protein MreC [unclassified Parabacteroides]MDH6305479.1 rod shape-determining protein MreC [Parabacteroides sp. PH5-39]MDH6316189.1 rod shape-determining protein MreC [Parabacteroides sp. PF5-13]MDH6320339.1 rod shape-determining protein MreC [Parabacteroides sp. PH5-13]MDH6324069.1 rod shape-determining protein MreC [Parabacteroides sp. PH5-8]MDH6327380.1 rod shape-determining protein MreC [Parabacteroides sp. PH5-41]
MRKLLDFLIRKRHWFLFILLELVSFALIYRNSAYQQNIMFSTANVVTANIVSVTGSVTSYLNLREKNKELLERNGRLELELLKLQDLVETMKADTASFRAFVIDTARQFPYSFTTAKVINNSVSYNSNYITLNKGRKDGVTPDMGVVSENGAIGVVSMASDYYSVVLPLLNTKFKLSCKVLRSSHIGSLSWNGREPQYANLDELPRHVEFQIGDTIVTSGFSAVFPEGILVGYVSSFERQRDDNFNSLKIKLATDFQRLSNVMVITNYRQSEQREIEEEAKSND